MPERLKCARLLAADSPPPSSRQEYLVVKVFEKKLGLFMTFLQFFGYAACAAVRRGIHRETGRKAPMRAYFGLGLLQVRRE